MNYVKCSSEQDGPERLQKYQYRSKEVMNYANKILGYVHYD